MKTLHISLLLLLSCLMKFTYAGGSILGRVTDPFTKAPVAAASVIFDCQGVQHTFYTNDSGYYYAGNIPAGTYKVIALFMSNKVIAENVQLADDEVREINLQLGSSVEMQTQTITFERHPLIDPLDVPNSAFLQREDFKNEPIISIDQIGETLGGGLVNINGVYYDRGARAGSVTYYIDGCKIMGNPDIPLCGLETYRAYTGFIPPKYGDTNGGVIVMETRSCFSGQ
jgi:hypothetical protein